MIQTYDPKVLEFPDFCCKVYPNAANPELSTLVSDAKVYAFLWYQAYREKKTRKGKKRKRGNDEDTFNLVDYKLHCEIKERGSLRMLFSTFSKTYVR